MNKAKDFGSFSEKLRLYFGGQKKIRLILIIGVFGIVLLIISGLVSSEPSNTDEQESIKVSVDIENYTRSLEKKLEEIICNISGAGKCNVMITMDCGIETVYAVQGEEETEASEGKESEKSRTEYVILGSTSSGKEALVIREMQPKVRGVIVVCEGGENTGVKINIINAVMSVFDISSAKISVQKMV